MKITGIEPILVGAPTPGVGLLSHRNYIFIRVHTDEGFCGLGESTLESHDNSVLGALRDIESLVIGEDPTRIEYLTQKMIRQLFSAKVSDSPSTSCSAVPAAIKCVFTSMAGAAAHLIPRNFATKHRLQWKQVMMLSNSALRFRYGR